MDIRDQVELNSFVLLLGLGSNMGGAQSSTGIPEGGTEGYHVLKVVY